MIVDLPIVTASVGSSAPTLVGAEALALAGVLLPPLWARAEGRQERMDEGDLGMEERKNKSTKHVA